MKKQGLPMALFLSIVFTSSFAQNEMAPAEGYTPQIGFMVDMLEDLKDRITDDVKELSQEETDYLFDENANSIGSLIMHLASTEKYYQVETLEGRSWTEEESEFWGVAGNLGDASRKMYRDKPIKYYLDLWSQVRQESLEGLKTKDDAWFAENISDGINNHYVWYHVMEHSANHMGQIALIKNRMNK